MQLYAKRMTLIISITFVIISAGGLAFFRSLDALIFNAGVLLTAGANVLKVYWLKSSVDKAAEVDTTYAANYVRGQGMLRMMFTLAVLVGAGFLSQLEVLGLPFLTGAVFGLLTMPIAAHSMGFFTHKDYKKDEGANTHV
jgi:voltage-gated potassium channel Kch